MVLLARVRRIGLLARVVPAGRVGLLAMLGPGARSIQDPWSRSGRFYVIRWKFENTNATDPKPLGALDRIQNKTYQQLNTPDFLFPTSPINID